MCRYLLHGYTQRAELTLFCAASKKQKAERPANAELNFAFAQLRAETAKNAALGPRRFPEIRKIVNFRPPEKSHFDKLSDPFAYNFEL